MTLQFTPHNVLSRLRRHIEGRMTLATRQLVYSLYDHNPEDTGFSETNWLAKIGTPSRITLGDYDPLLSPSQQDLAGQAAMVAQVRMRYRLSNGPIFISNNAYYIGYLEHRRPFVEAAISAVIE